jgi:ATP-dependent DNA helicase DinG
LKQRAEYFVRLFPEDRGRFHLAGLIMSISETAWRLEIEQLAAALERLREQIAACASYGEGWGNLEKRVTELKTNLMDIALREMDGTRPRFVHWYERKEKAISLSATPIEIAGHLRETLYKSVQFCIMTSATLPGGSFIERSLAQ